MLGNVLQPGLGGGGFYQQNLQQTTQPTFETDFSDKFEKSKNKVIYFSAASLLIGVFEFEEGTSALGFRLGGLTDYRLEWILWLVSAFMIANMLFRFLDERRRFERYKNEVNLFRTEFSRIIGRFKELSDDLYSLLKDRERNIFVAQNKFQENVKNFKLEILESKLDSDLENRFLSELQYMAIRVIDKVDRIDRRSSQITQDVSGLSVLIKQFQKSNKPVKSFIGIGRLRFLLFDVVAPVSLFMIASLVHFVPSLSAELLSLTENMTTESR